MYLNKTLSLQEDCSITQLEDSIFALLISNGNYYEFKGTAKYIVNFIKNHPYSRYDELMHSIKKEYDCPTSVEHEINNFISLLIEEGIVRING